MTNTPVIFSVIIPTYNRADKLKKSLESLTQQTFKNLEVLVCDDGSTDNTKQVTETFMVGNANIKYIYQQNWGGPARPRNAGIAMASGEWICFLDSDDYWYSNKLEKVYSYINDNDFIYHDLDTETSKGYGRKLQARQIKAPAFIDLMTNGNTIFTSGVSVRKNLLQQAGGFAEEKSLIAVEDFDLWLTLARMDIRFKHIPECLGCYWAGGGNITSGDDAEIKRLIVLYNRHLPFLNNRNKSKALKIQAYLFAKVYHKTGRFKQAARYYFKALASSNATIRFRASLFLLQSLLHKS